MSCGITKGMKTVISVEDSLMQQADEAARDLGMSRSGLISDALRYYLKNLREARVTERLNRAYADVPSPEDRSLVRKLRIKVPVTDRW